MFDLRYHVASLAAVFLALLIGILVGVGLSGRVDEKESDLLRERINALESRLESAGEGRANLVREQKAARAFIDDAYPLLVENRLRGKRIAILFVGSVDESLRDDVEEVLGDAGARTPLRMRALKIPIDEKRIDGALDGHAELEQYRGSNALDALGRELGSEFVAGADTPGWDALASLLVEEKAASLQRSADGAVVMRTVDPQSAETARFLSGLYAGLAESGVPVVGVESSGEEPSAVEVWDEMGLSTVDDVDAPAGRLALALLLAGGRPGNYGLNDTAADGILPPIEPLSPEAGG